MDAREILELLEHEQPQLNGPDADPALARLDDLHEDLISAFRRALDLGDAEMSLRFAAGLRFYFVDRGHVEIGRELVDRALALGETLGETSTRARALVTGANLAFRQGDNDVARTLFDEALEIARSVSDDEAEARTLSGLSRVEMRAGDYDAVRTRANESIARWDRIGDEVGRIGAFHMLAYVNFGDEDYQQARELFTQNLDSARRIGYRAMVATESGNLAAVERELGNLERAEDYARESLAMSRELGSAYMIPYGLADLGGLASEQGDSERAARLLGAAERAFELAGLVMDPGAEPVFLKDVERVRDALDDSFEAEWEAGRALPTDDAIELALADRG